MTAVGRRIVELRVWLVALLAAFAGLPMVLAATAKADDLYYCDEYIFGYNACSYHGNGIFSQNHAYVPGARYGGVCERATIRYHANNISRNCTNTGLASAGCDIQYYYGNQISAYAGNNQQLGQEIVGHAYIQSDLYCV